MEGRSPPTGDAPASGLAHRDASALLTSGRLKSGTQLGEYRVSRLIGAGGMGVVYEGVHLLLDRRVAIKVIAESFAHSEEAAARFLQEARAASALRHPNIVDLFAFDRLPDGRYYQVMELLEGRTLSSIIQERAPLSLPLARAVLQGLLAALDFAQRRGIVHRDIKPENVFVSGSLDGPPSQLTVKVLDFGLAKQVGGVGSSLVKSRTGIPMGTPAYMSPEQCRATREVDGRTDIYAAGVVLYEMLSGSLPFSAESAVEIMTQQITKSPPQLSLLVPVAPAIEAVVLKALAKRSDGRFQSAAEMLAAFEAAYDNVVADGAPSAKLPEPGSSPRPGTGPARAAAGPAKAVPQTLKSISPVTPMGGSLPTRSWSLLARLPRWTLMTGGAFVLVMAVILLAGPRQPPNPPASLVSSEPPAPAGIDGRGLAYVQEAERLAADRRVEHAIEVVAQARPLVSGDAQLQARLARVDRQLESALVLRQAQKHQQAGDLDVALQLAKQAYNQYPEGREAAQLIATVRQAQADQAPRTPEAARASGSRPAWLTLRTRPGASVFVDDRPVGRTPLRRLALPSGSHWIRVRLSGYRPFARQVTLHAGREQVLAAPLALETSP